MNKLCVVIFMCALSCEDESPREPSPPYRMHCISNTATISTPDYDSLFRHIRHLQRSIRTSPDDTILQRDMLRTVIDTQRCTYLVVGRAPSTDSSLPLDALLMKQKDDALRDGIRWALYLKAWHGGTRLAYGKKIFGRVHYSRILLEQIRRDTLYQLIQIPIHSIVIH